MNFLEGYKTYLVALSAFVGAWAAFATGDATLSEAIQLSVTAILGATIRRGVETSKA